MFLRTYESPVVQKGQKGPFVGRCSNSTTAAARAQMTTRGRGWVAAEEVLATGWLEER